MSLRTGLLPALESIRSMLDTGLDWRRYDVTMRLVAWDGGRPGVGTKTTTDVDITHATGARVKVLPISSREIAASGGKYRDGDKRIGPITPEFSGGGRAVDFFDPAVESDPAEVFFKLTGPGHEAGRWHKKVDQSTGVNLRYEFTVRAINVDEP